MRNLIKPIITIVLGISIASGGIVAPVFAAKPNNQACLGQDFSGNAKTFKPLGQTLTSYAPGGSPIIQGGLGDEMQNYLAGNTPDTFLPNSCNN